MNKDKINSVANQNFETTKGVKEEDVSSDVVNHHESNTVESKKSKTSANAHSIPGDRDVAAGLELLPGELAQIDLKSFIQNALGERLAELLDRIVKDNHVIFATEPSWLKIVGSVEMEHCDFVEVKFKKADLTCFNDIVHQQVDVECESSGKTATTQADNELVSHPLKFFDFSAWSTSLIAAINSLILADESLSHRVFLVAQVDESPVLSRSVALENQIACDEMINVLNAMRRFVALKQKIKDKQIDSKIKKSIAQRDGEKSKADFVKAGPSSSVTAALDDSFQDVFGENEEENFNEG